MQPTEQKQPTEKELIAHIRESLQAHEELYEVGAWEKFNAPQQPQKRPILWWIAASGVAAVLVLCFSLFLTTTKKPVNSKDNVVKNNSSPIVEQPKNTAGLPKPITTTPKLETKEAASRTGTQAVLIAKTDPESATTPLLTIADPAQVTTATDKVMSSTQQTAVNTNNEQPAIPTVVTPKNDPPQVAKAKEEKPNIMDFLNKETEKDKARPQQSLLEKRESRWELGIMVTPSFGNTKKLNMGYGLSMEYSLSDKLSLNSGIAYNEMTASKNAGNNEALASASASAIAKSSRSLESVSEKVVGLDIPLELKYHLSKNVYANFGISAFAVINYKRDNTYIEQKLVPNYLLGGPIGGAGAAGPTGPNNPSTGQRDDVAAFTNSSFVNQKVVESAPESEQNGSNYIGFYNFSMGYKKKISKNNALSIEPFMKLPMKEVSKDNLKLISTGLRLKLDF